MVAASGPRYSSPAVPTDCPLHILAIGDLGGAATDHVGDEAMFAANVELVRSVVPEARMVALSRDPAATSRRHGVAAREPIGFPSDAAAARQRWEQVLTEPDPAAAAVLAELESADVLLISGGGNLNSSWPQHLFERLALMAAAERLGRRVILLGQTLGPHFDEWERNELARRLRSAALLGVREEASRELAELWQVPTGTIHDQLDDAAFLTGAVPAGVDLPAEPFVAVTFAGTLGDSAAAARELAQIAHGTGAPLIFLPHAAPEGDAALGRELAARCPARVRVLPLAEPGEVAAITGRAAMVVSGRYHPLVFGLSAGVPALGVFFDEYTRVKVRGALGRAGLEAWSLPAALAWEGGLSAAALELWSAREAIAGHLARGRVAWRSTHAQHRERVAAAIRGLPGVRSGPVDLPAGPQPSGSWARLAGAWTAEVERGRRERQQLAYFRDVAAGYALSLVSALAARPLAVSDTDTEPSR